MPAQVHPAVACINYTKSNTVMNNNNNKPLVLLAGAIAALFAISFVVRIVVLSEMGLRGG